MQVLSLERAPVRTRESGVTQAAWRMEIEADEGRGAITLIDEPPFYRGDGIFLGWSQEQLAATYKEMLGTDNEQPFDVMQMG